MLPILVIDNNDLPIYQICRHIWRSNVQKFQNEVKLFFLRSSKDVPIGEVVINGEYIYTNKSDSSNVEIINKTLVAIKYLLDDYEFDWILRTNLSSFYSIENLLKCLHSLPKTNAYAGYPGIFHNGNKIISFCSGSGYLISKDVCRQLLVARKVHHEEDLPDDVWVGNVLESVPRINMTRTDFCSHIKVNSHLIDHLMMLKHSTIMKNEIHFRVKCPDKDERINIDSLILLFLFNYFNP